VWETTVDGRPLSFRLAGVNNQNFIMRDEETGSWWQQVSGECVLGPLKGRRLRQLHHDELTFATWRGEGGGRVLRPDPKVEATGKYAPPDWEERMQRVPVATTLADPNAVLPARTLVAGVSTPSGASKAYPVEALRRQNPVIDTIGGTPVVVVMGDDGKSVRAFDRRVEGRALELYLLPETSPLRLADSLTGAEWDFTGAPLGGQPAGRRLEKLPVLLEYWFDWKAYHPETGVYLLGER